MSNRVLACLKGLTAIGCLAALPGCGNGLATVTGNISVDGQPLAGSERISSLVCFFPEGGTGAPAVGLLDSEGRYEVRTGSQRGVAPGSYVVTITATEVIPSKTKGAAPSGRPVLPRRYANPKDSGLRVQVGEGSNEFDFELDGTPDKPKKRRRRR